MPEPPLDRDAVEAAIVELDEPLRLHDEALVDVVELQIAGAAGGERAKLAIDERGEVRGDLDPVLVRPPFVIWVASVSGPGRVILNGRVVTFRM